MNSKKRYEQVLKELAMEFGGLIDKYASKLHKACHEDNSGPALSHPQMLRKIRHDCVSTCTDIVQKIVFDGVDEEAVNEILQYNYDRADIEHMLKIEKINPYTHLRLLEQNCIKRTDSEWSLFKIDEKIQNKKFNPGPMGSKRTQFCKCCGDEVYISEKPGR